MNYPAASSGISSVIPFGHSVLDTESSQVFWIPASAGITNSRQAARNVPKGFKIRTCKRKEVRLRFSTTLPAENTIKNHVSRTLSSCQFIHFPCTPPVFPIDIGPEGARGRAFTHAEQGSCPPLVNKRASLSLLAYPKLPAIPLRNLNHRSLTRRFPPNSACVNALPLALAFLHHFGWGPGAWAIRAGSIGRDIFGKAECVSHRRMRRVVSSRLIHGENSASCCQAKRPGPRALGKPYEETGGGQDSFPLVCLCSQRREVEMEVEKFWAKKKKLFLS
jgi:hypothetical protein